MRIFAPAVEPHGYGHAFLDLTGTTRLFGRAQDVAARIRREANQRLGLPLSVGVATNKLVSQAAIKAERRTGGQTDREPLLCVPSGGERGFLAPHPVDVLPDLDAGVRARLSDYQLDLIGEVASISESALCAVFGGRGRTLRARARGIDPRPVLPPERQAEFQVVHALSTDTNDLEVLHPMLRCMSEHLGRRLRAHGLTAGRLRVQLTYADYTAGARAVPLSLAMLDSELWAAARSAFALANTKRIAVRSVALTLDRLMEPETQLELWSDQRDSGTAGQPEHTLSPLLGEHPTVPLSQCSATFQHALDSIHGRYGARGIIRGHQAATIFPKVALPSRTRCASAN
jgi:DNA polymerase-4